MTKLQKVLRVAAAACVVGVVVYAGWQGYDRYTWARDRRAIAAEAEAGAAPFDLCIAVHAPKLTRSDLERLKATTKVLRESYDKKFMPRTHSGLAFGSRTRTAERHCRISLLGIDWQWEDAAACLRLLAHAPERERAEIESSFREMEQVLSEAVRPIDGARVIVHGLRDAAKPSVQALETTEAAPSA